ncbi:hypothetical protein G7Y89_g4778 [Cudoniella acicularis]|uniref:Uncharacterized protein n=1 Tax=Cudoniella acicularis TaxID=354080 RepID=A0A8H4RNR6_9HELO|nr:hypothetical protein G7Y89_g4778 [Cudoniella acicularis]
MQQTTIPQFFNNQYQPIYNMAGTKWRATTANVIPSKKLKGLARLKKEPANPYSIVPDGHIFHAKLINGPKVKELFWEHTMTRALVSQDKLSVRRELSRHIPSCLHFRHHLTQRQLDVVGYIQMDDKPHYVREPGGTLISWARYFAPEATHDLGMWPQLSAMQKTMCDPAFEAKLQNYLHDTKGKKRTFELGMTIQQGHWFIQRAKITKADDLQVN